jgi:hypothetical protein
VSTPSAEQGRLGHPSRRPGNGALKRLRAVGVGLATFAVPSGGLLGRAPAQSGSEVTVTESQGRGDRCWRAFMLLTIRRFRGLEARPLQAMNAVHERMRAMLTSMPPQLHPDER